jgi:hypothetical protein
LRNVQPYQGGFSPATIPNRSSGTALPIQQVWPQSPPLIQTYFDETFIAGFNHDIVKALQEVKKLSRQRPH